MSAQANFKCVLLGNPSTGKTCLFNRYVHKDFTTTSLTIGAYYSLVYYQSHSIAIWDTAGQERFGQLTSFYCRNAHVAIVCFDLCDLNSFLDLEKWISKIATEGSSNCVLAVVGTKADLVAAKPSLRKVNTEDATQYATSIGAYYFETSAKTGSGVNQLFQRVFDKAIKEMLAPPPSNNELKVDLDAEPQTTEKKSGGCC